MSETDQIWFLVTRARPKITGPDKLSLLRIKTTPPKVIVPLYYPEKTSPTRNGCASRYRGPTFDKLQTGLA